MGCGCARQRCGQMCPVFVRPWRRRVLPWWTARCCRASFCVLRVACSTCWRDTSLKTPTARCVNQAVKSLKSDRRTLLSAPRSGVFRRFLRVKGGLQHLLPRNVTGNADCQACKSSRQIRDSDRGTPVCATVGGFCAWRAACSTCWRAMGREMLTARCRIPAVLVQHRGACRQKFTAPRARAPHTEHPFQCRMCAVLECRCTMNRSCAGLPLWHRYRMCFHIQDGAAGLVAALLDPQPGNHVQHTQSRSKCS